MGNTNKKIAIVQSNYIPWKGYFDLIAYADEFIIYDDMQYTHRDWRNRNKIKSQDGVVWLTVPVKIKGKYTQKIMETEIDGGTWSQKHWKAIEVNYKKAPYYGLVAEIFAPYYLHRKYRYLSELNKDLITVVCKFLDIKTKISLSSDYKLEGGKTERLINLCKQAGGKEYVSGPTAKNYIDENIFSDNKIKLSWFDYSGYPEYGQLWGEFVHNVTILDLLFNCGYDSSSYMKNLNP